jgi:hypothetical protein
MRVSQVAAQHADLDLQAQRSSHMLPRWDVMPENGNIHNATPPKKIQI